MDGDDRPATSTIHEEGAASGPSQAPATASASPKAIPRPRNRPGTQSAFITSSAFVGSPGALPTSQSYGSPSRVDVSAGTPLSRTARDYFGQPGSAASGRADITKGKRPLDPMPREWTVFGQLLEDDRTPGIRGSDTPLRRTAPSTPPSGSGPLPSQSLRSLSPNHGQNVSESVAQSLLATSPAADRENDEFFQDPVALRRQSIDTYDSAMSDNESQATRSSSTCEQYV